MVRRSSPAGCSPDPSSGSQCGAFHEQVAGVVEGFAERSAPRDDARGDSPGGVGLYPDRHPRVPLASVEHAPGKGVRNGPWVPPGPETMVPGSCVGCASPQRDST